MGLTYLQIIQRLAAFDARFSEMEKQQKDGFIQDGTTAPSQDGATELIDDLMFSQHGQLGGYTPGGVHGNPLTMDLGMFGISGFNPMQGLPPNHPFSSQQGGAYIRTLSPTEVDRGRDTQGEMTWGSEVELPQTNDQMSPPVAPIINIQAPTESNLEKSQRALTPSAGTRTPRTRRVEIDVMEEQLLPDMPETAVPDPRERDLPPPPSESIRSNRPSPAYNQTSLPYTSAPTTHRGDTPMSLEEALDATLAPQSPLPSALIGLPPAGLQRGPIEPITDNPDNHSAYKTAVQTPPPSHKDRMHIIDPINATMAEPMPWDLVTQRLYSWALVWEESTFTRAMGDISLGKQVEEFALSIFIMMTFKRSVDGSCSLDQLTVLQNVATKSVRDASACMRQVVCTPDHCRCYQQDCPCGESYVSLGVGNAKRVVEELPSGSADVGRIVVS